jgi:hypothetical protein
MALQLWQAQKYYSALLEKYTPEEAARIWAAATGQQPMPGVEVTGTWERAEAQAKVQDAIKAAASDKMPYTQMERPRLLEEGLPIPPDYAFWLAILYMLKKHPAMLERLAKTFMDKQATIISHLAQAGAGNIVTAYSHSFLIALILEQNYMIRQRGADDLIASLNVLVGAQALTNLLQGFAVPEVLTFAATGIPITGRPMPSVTKTK